MVDCSHANSSKKPELQLKVGESVIEQITAGNQSIMGVMLESNLHAGNQPIPADLNKLKYGISVTDGCIDWDDTEELLRDMASRLEQPLKERVG
jgi:3-deoxy-7-phosphoheptulonate synthase